MKNSSLKPEVFKNNQNFTSILLGRIANCAKNKIGFVADTNRISNSELTRYGGDAHLTTIGKTGSGKSRYSVMAALLTYVGSIVVLDIKGELYKVTARCRKEMGQKVILLDPFNCITENSDRLNPFDETNVSSTRDIETTAQGMAQSFSEEGSTKEPVWDYAAVKFVSSLICYILSALPLESRNLKTLVELLNEDDVVYNLAVILDTQKGKMSEWAYRGISSFLQITDVTRSGMLFTAINYFRAFNSPQILESVKDSTLDLQEFISGVPMTIYIVIPPVYIQSHFALIKIWFHTLLKAITERREIPIVPTLFILDEVAQFGHFALLENIMTIGRGYGVKVWLLLQSIQQLQQNYPKNWRTMLDNCDILQLFGVNNMLSAKELSEITDIPASEILKLKIDEQFIVQQGTFTKARKLDYLTDELFTGLFDENPYYKNFNKNEPRKSNSHTR